jgi:hypothetical protein
MTAQWRDPVYTATDLYARLNKYDVELSADVTNAHETFAAISIPAEVDIEYVAHAIATGAPAKTIAERVNEAVAAPILRAASARAKEIAANRLLDALRDDADAICEDMRPAAEGRISKIEKAAICGDISLDQLVRTGRHEEAHAQANLATNLAELWEMYRVRNEISRIGPGDVQPVDVSEFHTLPTYTSAVQLSDRQSDAAKAHSLHARGARRWWATKAQIRARRDELAPVADAAQAAIEAARSAAIVAHRSREPVTKRCLRPSAPAVYLSGRCRAVEARQALRCVTHFAHAARRLAPNA